jgi:hypothetical protein
LKCDLKCPPEGKLQKIAPCCRWCARARRKYLTEQNEHLWTDDRGFLGDNGCRLPRKEVPQECKDYDCKKTFSYVCQIIYKPIAWRDGKWQNLRMMEGCFVGMDGNIKALLETIEKNLKKCNIANGLVNE